MNEQLQKALSDLINKSISGIDKTKDFLVDQLPDVIQQLLLWHGIKNFVYFSYGIIGILFIIFGSIKYIKWVQKSWEKWDQDFNEIAQVFSIIFGVVLFAAILITSINSLNLEWLQIWLAPKVWLIEYATKLIK